MGAWHTETVYAVTDLGFDDIRARQLAEIIRDHWSIENKVHWIRDVTFTGNRSQIRRQRAGGHGHPAQLRPRPHRVAGHTNIAAACRHTSRHPIRAADLLT
jgi:hypothetical protein